LKNRVETIVTFLGFCAAVVGIGLFMGHTLTFIQENFDSVMQLLRRIV